MSLWWKFQLRIPTGQASMKRGKNVKICLKCFLKLLACLACHSWYREVKFSSQRHRYVWLMCHQISASCQYSFCPISWSHHEVMMKSPWSHDEVIMTYCNRHGFEGVLARGWNLVTQKSTYLCPCVENFSSLYLLWQASQASKFPAASFNPLLPMMPSWNGTEGVLARGWNLVKHKSTYLCRCDENFSSLYQLARPAWKGKKPLKFAGLACPH